MIYSLFKKSFGCPCNEITCPMLCMAGEGENENLIHQAKERFEKIQNSRKKLIILTKEDGGEAHCQLYNLSLLNQVIFDWLDEVLETMNLRDTIT